MKTNRPRFFYGYVIVIISFFSMMVILGLQSSFGIVFKPIIEDMGWSRAITSGAFSLNQMVFGICGIGIGFINDRVGPRVAVTICGLFSVLGCLLMSQVQAIWQIYLFFGVLVGVGNCVYVPLLSSISRWFVQRRGTMSGIAFAGAGFGTLILPPLATWLLALHDWRWVFVFMSIIIFVFCVVTAQFLKKSPGQVIQISQSTDKSIKTPVLEHSFSFKEAMHTTQFWLFAVAFTCYGFSFSSLQLHVVPYATDVGISAAGAATILTVMGAAALAGQFFWGSIGDKIGFKRAFLVGMILALLAAIVIMPARELWAFYIFAIFLGLAFGNSGTEESPLIAWLFGLGSHGTLLGFFEFSFTIGAAIGPFMFGYIFDYTGSYQLAFWIAGILSTACVILTMLIKKTERKTVAEST